MLKGAWDTHTVQTRTYTHIHTQMEQADDSYRSDHLSGADIQDTQQWQTAGGQLGYPDQIEVRKVSEVK